MWACVSYEWTCLHPEGLTAAQRCAIADCVPETWMARCGIWGLWCGLNCCAYLMGKPEDVCFGGDSRMSQLCHISLKLRLHRTLVVASVPSSGLLEWSQWALGPSSGHSRERDWLGSIILKTWLPLSASKFTWECRTLVNVCSVGWVNPVRNGSLCSLCADWGWGLVNVFVLHSKHLRAFI